MKIINSDKVPEALGPYSHATVINGFVLHQVKFTHT